MEILRWLCHHRVALGIRVPNVYGKEKRSKKDLQPEIEAPADSVKDPSKSGRMVMVR